MTTFFIWIYALLLAKNTSLTESGDIPVIWAHSSLFFLIYKHNYDIGNSQLGFLKNEKSFFLKNNSLENDALKLK